MSASLGKRYQTFRTDTVPSQSRIWRSEKKERDAVMFPGLPADTYTVPCVSMLHAPLPLINVHCRHKSITAIRDPLKSTVASISSRITHRVRFDIQNAYFNEAYSYFNHVALRPNARHGLLILEVYRSHSDSPQSARLLWTSDQFVADLYLTIHN